MSNQTTGATDSRASSYWSARWSWRDTTAPWTTSRVSTDESFNKNRNFLSVNANCKAEDILAIMKDFNDYSHLLGKNFSVVFRNATLGSPMKPSRKKSKGLLKDSGPLVQSLPFESLPSRLMSVLFGSNGDSSELPGAMVEFHRKVGPDLLTSEVRSLVQ